MTLGTLEETQETMIVPWTLDEVTLTTQDGIGLEDLNSDITQGCNAGPDMAPYFNPCNIIIEQGIHYLSLYICCSKSDAVLAQRLAIWFGSLKETDVVRLSVSSKFMDVPLPELTTIMAAMVNSKATVEIVNDQIVVDNLAYFYLLADKVISKPCGRIFVPSYIVNRESDMSSAARAVSDFYRWIVENSVERKRLTQEEADRLNSGKHVVLPKDRFMI